MLRPRGGCILLNLSPVALGLAAYETFGQVMFAEVCGLAVREIMSGLPGLIVAEFNRVRVRVQVSTVQAIALSTIFTRRNQPRPRSLQLAS